MKYSNMRRVFSVALFLLVPVVAACASERGAAGFTAADKRAAGKVAALQQSYTWHDGNRERQVWLDPALLVEFNAIKTADKSAVKVAHKDAVLLPSQQGGMRLWHLGAGVNSDEVARSLNVRAAGTKASVGPNSPNFSPVLRDAASAAGHMRALPGNVIVYLNPAWDVATINAWADRNQLEVVKKLEVGPNIYVIKTAPGLEALNIANALRQSGEVVSAMPNWWEMMVKR